MDVINIQFYKDRIHSMQRRYAYEDDWIAPINTRIRKPGISTINIEIIYLNEKRTIECINELGTQLDVVESIKKFKFNVQETEINKVNVEFCNNVISLIGKLVNLNTIEIRTGEQLRAIYEYIILESKITKLEIDIYYDYKDDKNGVVCISNIFKLAGNNSCIRIMEFVGSSWYVVKEICGSYPQLEELVIHERNFYYLEELSKDENKTVCPNLKKISIGWGIFSLSHMRTVIKWSKNNDHMKTLSFNNVDFAGDALECLLDDINKGSMSRIGEFITTSCMPDAVANPTMYTIKRELEKRKTGVLVMSISERKGLGLTPSNVHSLLKLLGLK